MMKKLLPLSFRHRIFLVCVIVALVPICLSCITMYQFENTLKKQYEEVGIECLNDISFQWTQLQLGCRDAFGNISEENLIYNATAPVNEADSNKIYLSLYQIAANISKGSKISIYDSKGNLCCSTDPLLEGVMLSDSWGKLRKAADSSATIFYSLQNDLISFDTPLLSAVRAVRNTDGEIIGYVELTFTRDTFVQAFSGFITSRMSSYLLDEFGHVIYSANINIPADKQLLLRNFCRTFSKTDIICHEENRYFISGDGESGCYIILEQADGISKQALNAIYSLSCLGIGISLLVSIVFSVSFAKSLFHPVSQISKAMTDVEKGRLDKRIEIDRQDEFGDLARNFNHMAENLQQYLATIRKRGEELNESQIRLLQSQLNPHFLYNTLDTVKWMAKINSIPEIASIAENLAIILRRSISKEQFVTLKEELDMVDSYLDIQKIRFSNKFTWRMQVSDSLKAYMVPKLILQPLVENAIIHGFDHADEGSISIDGQADNGLLCISVIDDGCGMSAETVDIINSNGARMREGHLGLYNVSQIIQLNYGTKYGLKAVSKLNGGTAITVVLPAGQEV